MNNCVASRYGAFELKRKYQRHLLLGQLTVIIIVGFAIGAGWLYLYFNSVDIVQVDNSRDGKDGWGYVTPIQPPDIIRPGPSGIRPPKSKGGFLADNFEPTDEDVEYDEITSIPPENQPYGLNDGGEDPGAEGAGGDYCQEGTNFSDYIPPPDTIIFVTHQPIQIYEEIPLFPRIAREAGLGADVVIQAFIDKNGKVVKAIAAQCSRPEIGFEEAAVEAAYKCVYRPAIQNGHPVGVWVTYRVKFVLW